jgi:putative glutamine amidotransferase
MLSIKQSPIGRDDVTLSRFELKTPLIGLTTYVRNEEDRFQLPAAYCDAVVRAGGAPALLPPVKVDVTQWLTRLDGLILTGGGDVDPASYAGKAHAANYGMNRRHDAHEMAMVREALRVRLPVLAICRGAQILNVALGGTLIPHIPDEAGEQVPHRLPQRTPTPHSVAIQPGSQLARILGCAECAPISSHHQAIQDVGQGLCVAARAADGIVEAVELPGYPWLTAVQWHPELSAATDPVQQRLFDQFVQAAAERLHESWVVKQGSCGA